MKKSKSLQTRLMFGAAGAALLAASSLSFAATEKNVISWHTCDEMPNTNLQCATFFVPLNHQDKRDPAKIGLALAKLPATDPENKKGTIFFNPGGPGGSGVDFILYAGEYLYSDEVRAQYDLVGFDPRGVERSMPFVCLESYEEMDFLFELPAFPNTDEEIIEWEAADQTMADYCTDRGGDLMNHMSTADVARDLNLLRKAVGDKKLNYVGISYGTYIGATYANLFPNKVGRLVMDGVLDPVAWSTGRGWKADYIPMTTRLRSHVGAQDSLEEFFRTCNEGGPLECPIAGDAETRFNAVADNLKLEPLLITDPDGFEWYLTYADIVGYALGAMYSPFDWPYLAQDILWLEELQLTKGASFSKNNESFKRFQAYFEEQEILPQTYESFASVLCSDSDNPEYFESWKWAAQFLQDRGNHFAPLWTWASSVCHKWTGSQDSRYAGSFKTKTDYPVLVLSTLYDPATPLHGAKIANRLLKNSRLVTVNGWGHAALWMSECADQAVSDYFIDGTLPKNGLSCDADWAPFNASLPLGNKVLSQPELSTFSTQATTTEDERQTLKDQLINKIHF